MIVTAYDPMRHEYIYRCERCGTVAATITDEQIDRADNIMDLMPTEPHQCTPPVKDPNV